MKSSIIDWLFIEIENFILVEFVSLRANVREMFIYSTWMSQ